MMCSQLELSWTDSSDFCVEAWILFQLANFFEKAQELLKGITSQFFEPGYAVR